MNRLFTKSIALIALVGALIAFSPKVTEAAFLTGNFSYKGDSTTNNDANLTLATQITIVNASAGLSTGDFTLVPSGTPLTHTSPIVFAPVPGTPYNGVWTALLGTWSFDLLNLAVDAGTTANSLVLVGSGVFHAPGFDDTQGTWRLSTQNGGGTFTGTFSVTQQAVPEPLTLSLLGLGLAGLAARRRATK